MQSIHDKRDGDDTRKDAPALGEPCHGHSTSTRYQMQGTQSIRNLMYQTFTSCYTLPRKPWPPESPLRVLCGANSPYEAFVHVPANESSTGAGLPVLIYLHGMGQSGRVEELPCMISLLFVLSPLVMVRVAATLVETFLGAPAGAV